MGEKTGISWTDATWNPWQGCHKVSLGCRECYMFREKKHYGQDPNVVVRSKPHTFNLPNRLPAWHKVFTCSWSDWWIEEADPWRDDAWALVDRRRDLIFQIVTKRIDRAFGRLPWGDGTPWPHVWMIVSAENQKTADERITALGSLNVAVRGVSYEPALEAVEFHQHRRGQLRRTVCPTCEGTMSVPVAGGGKPCPTCFLSPSGQGGFEPIDWVIMGVESGPNRTLGHVPPDYWSIARATHAQCREAGVAFYQKQGPIRGRLSTEPMEWALEDRVQQCPGHLSGDGLF